MSQVDIKIDFPYDLNNLFSLNYSFEILKQSIEYLARTQAAHTKILNNLGNSGSLGSISQLPTNVDSHHFEDHKELQSHPLLSQDMNSDNNSRQQLDSNKNNHLSQNSNGNNNNNNNSNGNNSNNSDQMKMIRDHDNIIRNLRHEVNQLKDKNITQDNQLSNLQKSLDKYQQSNDQAVEDLRKLMNDMNGRLANTEDSITLLKAMGSTGGNGSDGAAGLQSLLNALEQITDKLRKEVYANFGSKSDVDVLKRKIEDILEQLKEHDKTLQNQDTRILQCRDITDTNNLDIQDLKKAMNQLKNNNGNNNSHDNDSNQNNKNDSSQNNNSGDNSQAINDILNRLKFIERDLESKVDQDVFDNEIAALRELIGNLEDDEDKKKTRLASVTVQKTTNHSSLSQKEIESLKMILERFPQLEDTQQRVLRDIKSLNIQVLKDHIETITKQISTFVNIDDFDGLQSKFAQIQQKLDKHTVDIQNLQEGFNNIRAFQMLQPQQKDGASTNDIMLLRNRMEYVESALTQQKKTINELTKKLEDFMNEANQKLQAVDEALIKQLVEDMHRLKNDYAKYKEDTNEKINNIMDLLSRKADKQDLHLLEAKLLEKLNEMLQKFLGMFADKKDTNKRLSNLEKNMKSIFELLMTKNSPRQNEDDAMFTKKPLNGLSCASCERNIVNISGQMADYQPWKKLPFREPNDRISKYGPGFSKILAMMKPEQQSTMIDNSRIEQVNMRVNSTHQLNDQSFFNNSQTINADNTINVDMPHQLQLNLSTKNSARTGYQFYQKSGPAFGSRKNSKQKIHQTIEESPPRDSSMDKLPQLTVKRQQQ